MQKIPFIDLGGEGPLLHFAHANGYPALSYRRFLHPLLAHHRVIAIEQRPLWPRHDPPPVARTWDVLSGDLETFLDQQGVRGVIGVGHSLGGVVSLFTAARRPDLFSALVLLDPVFYPARTAWLTRLTPMAFKRRIPYVRKTLGRPDHWRDQEEAFAFHRGKRAFSGMSDAVLRDYIEAGTERTADGVRLRFPKEWEARIYCSLPLVWGALERCAVPVLGVRGAHSDVLLPEAWQAWQRRQPGTAFRELPGAGHLFPLEKPEASAHLVLEWLAGRNGGSGEGL